MSMELLNQFMNDAVDFTFTAIVLALTLFALAAIWKWLIGVSIRFVHWLCPGLFFDVIITNIHVIFYFKPYIVMQDNEGKFRNVAQ